MDQLTFPVCVLPGCRDLCAAWGQPCTHCQHVFGPYLRREPATPILTPEEITARDQAVRAALHHRPSSTEQPEQSGQAERRRNQRCWLCEEQHTCTRTPQGWECDTCTTTPTTSTSTTGTATGRTR